MRDAHTRSYSPAPGSSAKRGLPKQRSSGCGPPSRVRIQIGDRLVPPSEPLGRPLAASCRWPIALRIRTCTLPMTTVRVVAEQKSRAQRGRLSVPVLAQALVGQQAHNEESEARVVYRIAQPHRGQR